MRYIRTRNGEYIPESEIARFYIAETETKKIGKGKRERTVRRASRYEVETRDERRLDLEPVRDWPDAIESFASYGGTIPNTRTGLMQVRIYPFNDEYGSAQEQDVDFDLLLGATLDTVLSVTSNEEHKLVTTWPIVAWRLEWHLGHLHPIPLDIVGDAEWSEDTCFLWDSETDTVLKYETPHTGLMEYIREQIQMIRENRRLLKAVDQT